MALPTTLTNYAWSADGVQWAGPFISSAGNVYVIGPKTSSSTLCYWKATDPTSSFTGPTSFGGVGTSTIYTATNAHQVGDVLHITTTAGSGSTMYYYTLDMSTDTTASVTIASTTGYTNYASGIAKRSTGGDVIVAQNYFGVVNMGKTYGRIQARRIAGGTTVGAVTDIGIGAAATTAQAESIDSVVLASSDRVHIFWSQGNATAGSATTIIGRCVKSSDNLDGTSPATASYNVSTTAVASVNVDDKIHASGQAFLSSANVIALQQVSSSLTYNLMTATDADTPSWTQTSTALTVSVAGFGTTNRYARHGGSPYDGTNRNLTGAITTAGPRYETEATFGSPQNADSSATATDAIMCNVYTRAGNVVLAYVYDQTLGGTWVYNEVVLRAAAAATFVPNLVGNSLPQIAPFAQSRYALTPGTPPPVWTNGVRNIRGDAIPQLRPTSNLQYNFNIIPPAVTLPAFNLEGNSPPQASVISLVQAGLPHSTVETVPVPIQLESVSPPQAQVIGTLYPGAPQPSIVEQVPTFFQLKSVAQLLLKAIPSTQQSLSPGDVESVPVPQLLQSIAQPQLPGTGFLQFGQPAPLVETVPVPILLESQALPLPSVLGSIYSAYNIIPPTILPVFTVEGTVLPIPIVAGNIQLGLIAGTPPFTPSYVPLIQSMVQPVALPISLAYNTFSPGDIETVPTFFQLSSRSPLQLKTTSFYTNLGSSPGLVE